MRITHDALLKIAKETVEKRYAHDSRVTAVFLVGSLRPDHAPVELASDVDLLVLHNGELPRDREIVKLSNEYHLDITYEDVAHYAHPRDLRSDGWRGWAMWDPRLLFQRGRFFEYTQSVVRAQFEEPVNIINRSRFFEEKARAAWSEMQFDFDSIRPLKVLDAIFNAANSLVSLNGAPIPERKLMAEFPARAQALDQSDLIHTAFECVSRNVSVENIRKLLPEWEKAFSTASQSPSDLRLHPVRLSYYRAAIENQLISDTPRSALWTLLHTWALAAENSNLPEEQIKTWQSVCAETGWDAAQLPERLQSLDEFLDGIEEILEQVSVDNGL